MIDDDTGTIGNEKKDVDAEFDGRDADDEDVDVEEYCDDADVEDMCRPCDDDEYEDIGKLSNVVSIIATIYATSCLLTSSS